MLVLGFTYKVDLAYLAHTHLLTDGIFLQDLWSGDWGDRPRQRHCSRYLHWIWECWSDSSTEPQGSRGRKAFGGGWEYEAKVEVWTNSSLTHSMKLCAYKTELKSRTGMGTTVINHMDNWDTIKWFKALELTTQELWRIGAA